jgi:hypothetical protein
MKTFALIVVLGMAFSIGWYFTEPLVTLGQFTDALDSVDLAPSPQDGYVLSTDGTNNEWVVNSGGAGASSTIIKIGGTLSNTGVPTIDFVGGLTVTETPTDEFNITGLASASVSSSTLNVSNWANTRLLVASTTSLSGFDWMATSSSFLNLGTGSGGGGTVTSVDFSVPTGLSIANNPITTSGTLALTYASGYAGMLTASSTNWNGFYDTPSTRITAGTGIDWSSNTLNGVYTAGDALTLTGEDFDFDGGASPAGELGGTWASPTIDDSLAVTSWNLTTPTLTSFFGTPCTGNQFLQDIGDTGTFSCAEATGAGGGGALATTTDNNNQVGEVVSYITTDLYIGGSSSSTAEFNFDKDGSRFIMSSSTAAYGLFTIDGTNVLESTSGSLTLSGIDVIDATTEGTFETAIDTLANLVSIQGRTVTLADAGADAFLIWDDSASAYQNSSQADARTILGLGTAAYVATDLSDLNETTIETAIDTLSNLTSIGTIGTGVWQGTAIGDAYITKTGAWTGTIDGNDFAGGAIGTGDLLYGSSAGNISELGIGASSTVLASNGTLPLWKTLYFAMVSGLLDLTTQVTGILPVTNGGTGISSLGTGIATWLGTPSSANFLSALSDTLDLGGETSFEIPNGTGPTVDEAGEIAVDTTNDQFVYFGATKKVLSATSTFSMSLASTTKDAAGVTYGSATSTFHVQNFPFPVTVAGILCTSSTTGQVAINLIDTSGNATNGGACNGTRFALTSNNTFTAGEGMQIQVGSFVTGANRTSITVDYLKTAE